MFGVGSIHGAKREQSSLLHRTSWLGGPFFLSNFCLLVRDLPAHPLPFLVLDGMACGIALVNLSVHFHGVSCPVSLFSAFTYYYGPWKILWCNIIVQKFGSWHRVKCIVCDMCMNVSSSAA